MTGGVPSSRPLDEPALVRAMSTGFSVLLVGELAGTLVGHFLPLVGSIWLVLVGPIGYVAAGTRVGTAAKPSLQGALAALGAFSLTVPLRYVVGGHHDWFLLALNAVVSCALGTIAGRTAGTQRDRGTSARGKRDQYAHPPDRPRDS